MWQIFALYFQKLQKENKCLYIYESNENLVCVLFNGYIYYLVVNGTLINVSKISRISFIIRIL